MFKYMCIGGPMDGKMVECRGGEYRFLRNEFISQLVPEKASSFILQEQEIYYLDYQIGNVKLLRHSKLSHSEVGERLIAFYLPGIEKG